MSASPKFEQRDNNEMQQTRHGHNGASLLISVLAGLRYAAEEAKASGWKEIGSEHLLIGVLRVDECAASKLLATN